MISHDVEAIASRCRHYSMCKIDFLGTGVCASGREHRYVSYYPQGRMDICQAIAQGILPVTEALVDIVRSCDLCGICDRQCHFVTGLRPLKVMRVLKDYIEDYLRTGGVISKQAGDPVLEELRSVTGEQWAANDPAILVAYSNDPFPLSDRQMPAYVVLPGSRDEVAGIVKTANRHSLPFSIRGNGASAYGYVFTDGIVIDTNRMRRIEIDKERWVAAVEPGVTAFELQSEVQKIGCRVSTAEPAATVCGNIMCSGIFSTWAHSYGVLADNFADLEFVGRRGDVFTLNQVTSPNLFAFREEALQPPGICTKAVVRIYPTTDDEQGVLVPFSSFDEAVRFVRELGVRRIGLAAAILGDHYLSAFTSPSQELAERTRKVLTETLGVKFAVAVVGDEYAIAAVRSMTRALIDGRLFRALMLGLPKLAEGQWLELLTDFATDRPPYEILCREELYPLVETVLNPSPANIASAVEEDLRAFYEDLYSKPEMTDLVWLTMFRILSSRMSRHKHYFVFVLYVPLDDIPLIDRIIEGFRTIGEKHEISHEFGFLTPLDFGKRGILEYDYYVDQTDPAERARVAALLADIDPWLGQLCREERAIKTFKFVLGQGCARKEAFLYA